MKFWFDRGIFRAPQLFGRFETEGS